MKPVTFAILCLIAFGRTSITYIDATGELPQDAHSTPADAGQSVDTPMSVDALVLVDAFVPTDTATVSLDSTAPPDGSSPDGSPPDGSPIDAGSRSCSISLTQSRTDPTLILITLEVHCTEALATSIVSVFDGRTLLIQDPSPRVCESFETTAIRLRSVPAQLSAGASFVDIHGIRFSCATR